MEIFTTAQAATNARANLNGNNSPLTAAYSKNIMASRALQANGSSSEVNVNALEKGDVFKGEITNVTGKSVTVSLGNGQSLAATLLDNININIGNNLYFEVQENTGDKIYIKPLLDEKFSPENQTIEKSLQSANLQLNEKNMAVVKELMDQGMPIDRNSILKVLQQSVNNPGADVSTIVKLMKADIPVNEVSIEQFNKYQEHDAKLNTQMNNVIDGIANMYESLGSEDSFAGDILRFNQGIIDTFTNAENGVVKPELSLAEAFAMDEGEIEAFNNYKPDVAVDASGNPITNENGQTFPNGSLALDANGNPIVNSDGTFKLSEEFLSQLSEEYPDMSEEELTVAFNKGDIIADESAFTNEIQKAIGEKLKTLGISDDAIKAMLDPKNSAEDLLKGIQDYVSQDTSITDDVLKDFFSSREYQVIVKSMADNHWRLTPEQMKDKQQVEELFTRIADESNKLSDLAGGFSGGSDLSDESRNMNRNMQFMEMLNDKYTFAQIPLSLTNQDANSELYVYTNKKSLNKDKKDISILLHLDMDNLGSTDVHVSLNGSKVTTRFYFDDNRSVNVVKQNIDELSEKIESLGLSLNSEVLKRALNKSSEVEDFEKDFLSKDTQVSNKTIKRYTFDMRA